jgi:hypothetical protein
MPNYMKWTVNNTEILAWIFYAHVISIYVLKLHTEITTWTHQQGTRWVPERSSLWLEADAVLHWNEINYGMWYTKPRYVKWNTWNIPKHNNLCHNRQNLINHSITTFLQVSLLLYTKHSVINTLATCSLTSCSCQLVCNTIRLSLNFQAVTFLIIFCNVRVRNSWSSEMLCPAHLQSHHLPANIALVHFNCATWYCVRWSKGSHMVTTTVYCLLYEATAQYSVCAV